MGRRLQDRPTLLRVLSLLNNPLQIPSALDERRADAAEALALAEAVGDPEALYHAGSNSQINAVQAGDFALADRCLDTMRTLSSRLRQPTLLWMTAFKEAGAAFMAGDPEGAEELATEALQLGIDSGQPDALAIYGSQLMYIRHQQGRLGELISVIDEAVTANPGLPAFRPVLASAHLEAGNDATALELLDSAALDGFASLPLDFVWLMGVTFYALVAVELRAVGPAQKLYDLLTPFHDQVPFIGTLGFSPVSSALGGLASVLGRHREAEASFVEADEVIAGGGMKYFGARTHLEWGRMVAARGGPADGHRARSHLEQARTAAVVGGFATVERLAAAALSQLD
jgi:tetratricopeptide (TPR) repeat protein